MFSAADKLKCVERELSLRRRVYLHRVSMRAMTQQLADREIALMEAIKQDYEQQAAKERLL